MAHRDSCSGDCIVHACRNRGLCGRGRSPDTRCRLGEDNTSACANGYAAPRDGNSESHDHTGCYSAPDGDGNSESHGHIDCYAAPDGDGYSKSHTHSNTRIWFHRGCACTVG